LSLASKKIKYLKQERSLLFQSFQAAHLFVLQQRSERAAKRGVASGRGSSSSSSKGRGASLSKGGAK